MLQGPFFGDEESGIGPTHRGPGGPPQNDVPWRNPRPRSGARATPTPCSPAGLRALAGARPEEFDAILARMNRESPAVECLFAVNPAGAQVSETHVRPGVAFKRSALFHPARPGADHSMKEYVYLLMDGFMNRFRTDPYVSLASGNLCLTLSGVFRDAGNNNHILCMDVPWE
jgi:hypothetical protein